MRILLLNQFVPPDESPTAKLLGDLADAFRGAGHEVELVGEAGGYRARRTLLGSRAAREALSLASLLGRSVFRSRVDVVLAFTSPPLLPAVAALAARRHRARFAHWAMDVYPDIAFALGEIGPGTRIGRLSRHLMDRAYRGADLLVALDEDMAALLAHHAGAAARIEILPPWPPELTGLAGESGAAPAGTEEAPVRAAATRKAFTWLYSGNLGRAHEWRTLLDAQRLLEEAHVEGQPPVELVIQGGGPARPAAEAAAAAMDLHRIRWLPYAPEQALVESLAAADVLVATQRPETRGHLWPSKLAVAALLGRPIAWIGPPEGAVAGWLKQTAHPDSFTIAPGNAGGLAESLRRLASRSAGQSPPEPVSSLSLAESIRKLRVHGYSQWCGWITSLEH